MATGKTHDLITVWLAGPVFWLCHWQLRLDMTATATLTLGYLAGGLLLSPDLDTRSRPFYRWGVFRFIWWPYQWMVRHRSPLSHGLFVAPFLRLAYLTAVLILLYFALSASLGLTVDMQSWRAQMWRFVSEYQRILMLLAAGVWAGGLLHVLLDALTSALSAKGRRR